MLYCEYNLQVVLLYSLVSTVPPLDPTPCHEIVLSSYCLGHEPCLYRAPPPKFKASNLEFTKSHQLCSFWGWFFNILCNQYALEVLLHLDDQLAAGTRDVM